MVKVKLTTGSEKGSVKSYLATDLEQYVPPPVVQRMEAGIIEYVPLPKLVAVIREGMGIDEATPLVKAVAEAVEGLGIEENVKDMKTKDKANMVAEEMDLHVRTR